MGGLLSTVEVPRAAVWFVPVVLLLVRPFAVVLGTWRAPVTPGQRALLGWFGIRGIGTLYYLAYALDHGLAAETLRLPAALLFTTVGASIVLHGISVTPLMAHYRDVATGFRALFRRAP